MREMVVDVGVVDVLAEPRLVAQVHVPRGIHLVVDPPEMGWRPVVVDERMQQAALVEGGVGDRGADREIARAGAVDLAGHVEALGDVRDLLGAFPVAGSDGLHERTAQAPQLLLEP